MNTHPHFCDQRYGCELCGRSDHKTDQEKIDEAAQIYHDDICHKLKSCETDERIQGFKDGVAWRDANPKQSTPEPDRGEDAIKSMKEFNDAYFLGKRIGQKRAIEKVCEWLRSDEAKAIKHCNKTINSLFGQTGQIFADVIEKKFGDKK